MEWKEREKSDSYNLFIENGYNPLTAITLSNAGIKGLDDAWDFLYGDELISPSKIKNIDDAAQIIWKHIFQKNRICVFGDYDTDGVTSSAIMFLTLKRLGADVAVRLPDRIGEGYGINSKAVEEQIELGAKLFITVDNGVRANAEVDLIKRQGCDVVVIDHHEPGEILPNADVIIDLHIAGETYPFKELTGSGVSWKVAHYMLEQVHEHDFAMSLIDLAAIGTIGDVAPLIGENRVIVKRAIKMMRSCRYERYGVAALMGDLSTVTAENIAYKLSPCLNASGRLNSHGAELPLILLLENNPQIALELANKLVSENERRKTLQADCYKTIKALAEEQIDKGNRILVICHPDAQSGIAGLLAGNLKEEYNRPAIVFCPKEDINGNTVWTGSARSTEDFHILNAIIVCGDYLIRYGGHAMAAGLTIEAESLKLLQFEDAINCYAESIGFEVSEPIGKWDIEIDSEKISNNIYEEIEALEPFGAAVPKPIIKTRVKLCDDVSHKIIGNNKEHIKLFSDSFSMIGFNLADKYISAQLPQKLTVYGNLSSNYFKGERYNEIMITDFETEN